MARRYSSNPAGNMINIVMVVIIVVVLGLGVFAVWDKLSTGIRQNQISRAWRLRISLLIMVFRLRTV